MPPKGADVPGGSGGGFGGSGAAAGVAAGAAAVVAAGAAFGGDWGPPHSGDTAAAGGGSGASDDDDDFLNLPPPPQGGPAAPPAPPGHRLAVVAPAPRFKPGSRVLCFEPGAAAAGAAPEAGTVGMLLQGEAPGAEPGYKVALKDRWVQGGCGGVVWDGGWCSSSLLPLQ